MKAKLIVNNETETTIEDGIVAIGRAPDNTIPLDYDANISRYHAEIETRANEFWLVELGSSNGTTVNGEKVYDERKLADGDVITLGGSSEIVFELVKESKQAADSAPAAQIPPGASIPSVAAPAVPAAPPSNLTAPAAETTPSKMPTTLIVMGIVCGLALVAVVVAVAVSFRGAGKCQAKIAISNLENNETVSKETDVETASQDDDCAAKAVFYMDGSEFANVTDKPFKASFDPSNFPETDNDFHLLKVELEDENGEKIAGASEVQLIFQTLISAAPTPTPDVAVGDKPTPKPTVAASGKTVSAVDTQTMIQSLLGEFRGLPAYKFDPQFIQEVQKKTGEYAGDGYFARAQNYESIKTEYGSAGLDIPLGYILAMSRTQLKVPSAGGAEEGLWRMNTQLVTTNGYNGACGGESLSDAKQNCAAKASALYLKSLLVSVFDNDLIYAVAAFGMPTGEAANWKNTLPPNRADFWNTIKLPAQRDAVARFFAAGIVTENPQKFGLKKDTALSNLYKNYLVK